MADDPSRKLAYTSLTKCDGEPKQTRQQKSDESYHICDECRRIDFNKVLDLDIATLQDASAEGILIAPLGSRLKERPKNDCALCQLLFGLRIVLSDISNYEIRAFSYLHFKPEMSLSLWNPLQMDMRDIPQLTVVPVVSRRIRKGIIQDLSSHVENVGSSFVMSSKKPSKFIFYPRLLNQNIDFSIVKKWIAYCQRNHRKLCKGETKSTSGMKVIDCSGTRLAVVPAPHSLSFAALSYVWGASPVEAANSPLAKAETVNCLLDPLPRTISDAISVCKSLGINYLWVDRYCIDQSNAEEVHEQVSQMDSIYENADITLIAAAGENTELGLPGVGSTTREAQPKVRLGGDLHVVSTLPCPYKVIRGSTWSTRGWTFQEAILSRRRLVFTQQQIYFECHAMNCHESLDVDLDSIHQKSKDTTLPAIHSGIFGGLITNPFGSAEAHIDDVSASLARARNLIHEFTGRSLRFETDSLRAFAGILRNLSAAKQAILNFWGIPFVEALAEESFSESLLWKHNGRKQDRPASRRSTFPSWSWAGWKGQVDFDMTHSPYSWNIFQLKIKLEDDAGFTTEIPNLPSSQVQEFRAGRSSHAHYRILHLEGFILSPKALILGDDFGPATEFKFSFDHNFKKDEGLVSSIGYIFFSNPMQFEYNTSARLRNHDLELFLLRYTNAKDEAIGKSKPPSSPFTPIYFDIGLMGLVIENRSGSMVRVGIWTVRGTFYKLSTVDSFRKLFEDEAKGFRRDWLIERTVRLV